MRRTHHKKRSRSLRLVNSCLLVLFVAIAIATLFTLFSYRIINTSLLLVVTVTFGLIALISLLLILFNRAGKTTTFLLLLASAVSGVALFGSQTLVNTVGDLNRNGAFSEVEMSVVVKADSEINDISQVPSVLVSSQDASNSDELLKHLATDKGLEPATETVDSYQAAYERVQADGQTAMVMNSAYASLLEQVDDNYKDNLKTLYTYKIRKSNDAATTKKDVGDSFTIYISGIDTYGPVTTVSRSDVNILMTVNTKTNQVLLTTTPRDSYVQIPDGGQNQYDKLTHAGIYGVETSKKTLENLYGISIDYYARINFTSFLKLIDVLGGVEVYNDQAFNSHIGHYDFPVGNIQLDSEHALAFVRERYSLQSGDNDRGRNQEKVIAAIINKLASVNSITKYSDIVSVMKDSVQTDMPVETLMSIANSQIGASNSFKVTSQDVTGTGSTGVLPSFAMPNAALYMTQLDDASVAAAKEKITQVIEGDTLND